MSQNTRRRSPWMYGFHKLGYDISSKKVSKLTHNLPSKLGWTFFNLTAPRKTSDFDQNTFLTYWKEGTIHRSARLGGIFGGLGLYPRIPASPVPGGGQGLIRVFRRIREKSNKPLRTMGRDLPSVMNSCLISAQAPFAQSGAVRAASRLRATACRVRS